MICNLAFSHSVSVLLQETRKTPVLSKKGCRCIEFDKVDSNCYNDIIFCVASRVVSYTDGF